MDWLKKRLEEATAQINPFDKGRTASTVRASRKPAPVQTNRDNQPGFQLTNNSFTRGVSRVLDQQNMFDNGRSWQNRTPTYNSSVTSQLRDMFDSNTQRDFQRRNEQQIQQGQQPTNQSYREQQISLGNKRPYESLGAHLLGNSARFLNTAGAGISELTEAARGTNAILTDNDEALRASNERLRFMQQRMYQPDSGYLGAGTWFNSPEEQQNIGAAELTKRAGLNTLGTIAEVAPFARVARPVAASAKGGVQLFKGGKEITTGLVKTLNAAERGTSGILPRIGLNAGIDATTGAGESAARQYAQTGKIDPKLLAVDTLTNVGMGQTQVAASQITTKLAPNVKKSLEVDATPENIKRAANPVVAQIDDSIATLEMRRANASPAEQVRIGKAIDELIRERTRINQGGYIRTPGNDPLEALKAEARKYKSAEEFVEAQSNKFYGDNGDQKFLSGLIGKYKNRGKQGESLTKHFTNDELARYNQIISSENNLNSKQLTDLYNQATAPQVGKTPQVGTRVSYYTSVGEKTGTITKVPDTTKDPRIKGNSYKIKFDEPVQIGMQKPIKETYIDWELGQDGLKILDKPTPPAQVGKTPNYLDTNTSQQVLNKTIQPKSELWSRWFKQSDYKALPEIEQDILKNPQIKDAGTSRMYDYYKEMFGENMTYDEFLNKDITLYRGGNTRATNNMASYSLLERKAKRFGDVSSITVKPKDTYGMLGDFSEGEVFVPSKSTPPAQVGKTDPISAIKAESKRFGYDKGYLEEGQIANTIDELMKEQNAVREVGIPLVKKYESQLDGTKSIEQLMTPSELKAYRAAEAKSEKASKLLMDYFDYKKANKVESSPVAQVGKTDLTPQQEINAINKKALTRGGKLTMSEESRMAELQKQIDDEMATPDTQIKTSENKPTQPSEYAKPNIRAKEIEVGDNLTVRDYGSELDVYNRKPATETTGKVVKIERNKEGESIYGGKVRGAVTYVPEGQTTLVHLQMPNGEIKVVKASEMGRTVWLGKDMDKGFAPENTPINSKQVNALSEDATKEINNIRTTADLLQNGKLTEAQTKRIAELQSTPAQVGKTPKTQFESDLEQVGLKPNTPQSRAVSNTAPVDSDTPPRTPNQSQSPNMARPQKVQSPSDGQLQLPQPARQRKQPETKSLSPKNLSSSKDIIQLDSVDVNDPFRNKSTVQKLKNEFGRYFVDEDSEMINLLKRIEKETGDADLVEQWLQDTDLVRGSNSIANAKIRNSKNLGDALNGLSKKDVADLDTYAAARSELYNASRGMKTSKPVEQLQKTVQTLDGKYSKRFEALNNHYQELAKELYDAGIIDKTKLNFWAKNKDYVRVQRDLDDLLEPGYGSSKSRSFGTTSTSKKRTGSEREILSSTETALKRTQEIQLEIQRNKAASNTIDTLEKYGLAERIPQSQSKGKNVVKRFKNGKVEYYATNKDIKRVMDNVNPFQLGVIAQIISAPTRVFRAGTTALSAPFAVTNFARDQASSAIYSKNVMATHRPDRIVSGIYQGIKDFVGGETSDLWKKFESVAGDQTIFDELRNTKKSKQLIGEIRSGGGKVARGKTLINPINTVRNLEDLIGITEQATRYQNFKGMYESSIKKGMSEEAALRKATQAALQNSVNFRRAGSIARVANLMFPYFNAGIQGSRNLARSFRDRPIATTAKSVAFVGIPTVASVMFNYADDDSRRIYENISETEKEDNFIFVLPGAEQRADGTYEGVIKIPKPQGYREVTDPIRVYTEKFAGDTDSKSIGSMLKDMAGAMAGPIQTEDASKFLSSITPQILKPALQAKINKDLFWGSQVVPDYMLEGTDDPTKRAYDGTSGMARFIAEQLDVSPITVEKFITDTSGALGRYGINAIDNVLASRGLIPEEQIGGKSVKSDFSRRMFEARGIEKENMTDGQRYFKDVKDVTSKLDKPRKTAWDSYNQSNENFLGEKLFDKKSFAKKQAKAAAYVQFPELFQTDKALDAKARARGEQGNPLYDLTYEQALKVVQKKALLPGASDPELDKLYDQPWYEDFQAKESAYYDKIFGDKEQDKDNPYPQRSKELTSAMNAYYDMDTGQRRAWRNANPGTYDQFKQYYAEKEAWENGERKKIGLGELPKDEPWSTSGGSGGGKRKRKDYNLDILGDSMKISKSLRELLKEATL